MLSFEHVGLWLPDGEEERVLIRDLTAEVPRGALVAVTGSHPAARRAVLDLAAGILRPTWGRVCVEHVDLQRLSALALAGWRHTRVVVLPGAAERALVAGPLRSHVPASLGEACARAFRIHAELMVLEDPLHGLDRRGRRQALGALLRLKGMQRTTTLVAGGGRALRSLCDVRVALPAGREAVACCT